MKNIEPYNATVGARIQGLRKNKKLTQEILSEIIDVSPQQMSDIECGRSGISVQTLIGLCKALDTDADYILFGTMTRDGNNPINKCISKMTPEQVKCVEELVLTYAKACGIE